MNEIRLFKFEKDHFETPYILFVAKALSKDSYRVNLTKIYCDGKRIVATDGHRLHVYTPDECPLPKGMYVVEKKTKRTIYLSCTEMDNDLFDNYPDFDNVIPEKTKVISFSNASLANRLAEVLRAMGSGCVNINYFTDANSIDNIYEFQVIDPVSPIVMYGGPVLSLVMAMR